MNYVVCTTRPAALNFRTNITTACEYPKAGRRATGGIHGSGGTTTAHGYVLEHPSGTQWAHPDDPVTVSKRAEVPLPPGSTSTTLGADWFPLVTKT